MDSKYKQLREINERVKHCRLCRLWQTRTHAVPSEGNPDAQIMIIGQAPGRREDHQGQMFTGPSGEVLNRLLTDIGLARDDLYLVNILKCFLPNCRKPRTDEIDTCSVYLDREIDLVNPEILAPLGYHPIKTILRKFNLPVPNRHHFPELFGRLVVAGRYKILPLRHPATVVHQSATYSQLKANYRKLKISLSPCKWMDQCAIPRLFEAGRLNKEWIDQYCRGDWENCSRYRREERNRPVPDNLLPDGSHDNNL